MNNRNTSYIGLIDCNNFFVSCERIFRPDLNKRPVVVLSSNDGCVIARSQEVKDMGINMGVPYFEVKQKLTQNKTAVFSSNFTLYRDISSRIFDILRQSVDSIELYSIDESFFEIKEITNIGILFSLKEKIEQAVGVPVSIGVGATKTIAKYANKCAKKKTGIEVFKEDVWTDIRSQIPLGAFWGVGRGTDNKMRAKGINTVDKLISLGETDTKRLFGVVGERLRLELLGIRAIGLSDGGSLPHSITSSRALKVATTDKTVLEDAIAYHVGSVAYDLRKFQCVASEVTLYIKKGLLGSVIKLQLDQATCDTRIILSSALGLFNNNYVHGSIYRKIGITLSRISSLSTLQQTLFSSDANRLHNSEDLMKKLDHINNRFGRSTIEIGKVTTLASSWESKKNFVSKRYTTSWKEIPNVNAI